MSEIPADVMEAARETVKNLYASASGIDDVSIVARSILAERERCVAIVDEQIKSVVGISVKVAVKAERELCAEIADECGIGALKYMNEKLGGHSLDFQRYADGCKGVATAIRDRGKT